MNVLPPSSPANRIKMPDPTFLPYECYEVISGFLRYKEVG
jgi:hypothetical protein